MYYPKLASAKFLFEQSIDFKRENDPSTDVEVCWHFYNFAYNTAEISGVLSSTIVLISYFSKRFYMYFFDFRDSLSKSKETIPSLVDFCLTGKLLIVHYIFDLYYTHFFTIP